MIFQIRWPRLRIRAPMQHGCPAALASHRDFQDVRSNGPMLFRCGSHISKPHRTMSIVLQDQQTHLSRCSLARRQEWFFGRCARSDLEPVCNERMPVYGFHSHLIKDVDVGDFFCNRSKDRFLGQQPAKQAAQRSDMLVRARSASCARLSVISLCPTGCLSA